MLNWILFSTYAKELIICSDNTSVAGNIELIERCFSLYTASPPLVKILNGGSEVSKTNLLNQGFLVSSSNYLIFSDADIVWTDQAMREFLCVIEGGRIANPRKLIKWQDEASQQRSDSVISRSFLEEVKEIAQFTSTDGRIVNVQKLAIYPRQLARKGPWCPRHLKASFRRCGRLQWRTDHVRLGGRRYPCPRWTSPERSLLR